jgi:hypothetical protein
MKQSQWLVSARFDLAFFVAPPLVAIAVLWASPTSFFEEQELPVWAWVLLIPFIDVSHVYASLYRTYFDAGEFQRRKAVYCAVPALSFLAATIAYSVDALLFWRLLAYTAVWHFVRQQYGFLALYRHRRGERERAEARLDAALLYLATLYPLLYWHTHLPRRFVWFVDGDFLPISATGLASTAGWLYAAVVVAYLVKEGAKLLAGRAPSAGKNLLVLTTALTWYVGIVEYDSDYSFTVTNVISHGVPYVALVWIYCRRKWSGHHAQHWLTVISQPRWVVAFVGVLIVFAFCEEGLWDLLVWGDHPAVFGGRNHVLSLADSSLLAFVVGVLATPQATHYVLDGFIWKLNGDNPDLGRLLELDRGISERPASLPLRRARASECPFVDPSPEAECS